MTGDGREKVYKFTTAPDGPRFIYVDGVTNIRDLGGWATADGKKVRQGMIYRGGRLNESCLNDDGTNSLTITDAGKAVMLNDLGIKSEIDLRMAGKSYQYENGGLTDTSVLGSSVNYYNCQMNYSGNIFTEHKASIKQFFVLLSDEANYPVYFHCSIGTDRTGRMAYLLGGLLGVDKSDLYMDYLCSNFGAIGSSRDIEKIANVYDVVLSKQPGSTLQQKVRAYLKSIGVTDQQMDSIVRILTEG